MLPNPRRDSKQYFWRLQRARRRHRLYQFLIFSGLLLISILLWRNFSTLFATRTEVVDSSVEFPPPPEPIETAQDSSPKPAIPVDDAPKPLGVMDDLSAVKVVCRVYLLPSCKSSPSELSATDALTQLLTEILDLTERATDGSDRYTLRQLLKSLSDEGSIPGTFFYAKLLEREQRIVQAHKLYARLSEAGYGPASSELGRIDEFNSNRDLAISHYSLAIEQNVKDQNVRINLLGLIRKRGAPEDCALIKSLHLSTLDDNMNGSKCKSPAVEAKEQ